MSAADRMRQYRERQRKGRRPLRIHYDDVAWPQKLIALGKLPPSLEDDERAIAQATIDFLDEIAIVDLHKP